MFFVRHDLGEEVLAKALSTVKRAVLASHEGQPASLNSILFPNTDPFLAEKFAEMEARPCLRESLFNLFI